MLIVNVATFSAPGARSARRKSRDACMTAKAAIVGSMASRVGLAEEGGLTFVRVGNGRPDSDFASKARAVLDLLVTGTNSSVVTSMPQMKLPTCMM